MEQRSQNKNTESVFDKIVSGERHSQVQLMVFSLLPVVSKFLSKELHCEIWPSEWKLLFCYLL